MNKLACKTKKIDNSCLRYSSFLIPHGMKIRTDVIVLEINTILPLLFTCNSVAGSLSPIQKLTPYSCNHLIAGIWWLEGMIHQNIRMPLHVIFKPMPCIQSHATFHGRFRRIREKHLYLLINVAKRQWFASKRQYLINLVYHRSPIDMLPRRQPIVA